MKRQSFSDNTYSLTKGLHHINLARQYFEDLRLGSNGDIKAVFNQYIQKCEWIISNVKDRLPKENKEALVNELNNSIDIEAIMDKLIHLEPDKRLLIENLIDSILSGEDVLLIDNKK